MRWLTLVFALAACAHASSPAPPNEAEFDDPLANSRPDAGFATPVTPVTPPHAAMPPGVLARADVNRVLDAGIGAFLGSVHVRAVRDGSRFRGWEIVDATIPIGLTPGDVVLRVNGRQIQRPEEAQEIWDSLRKAGTLVITYAHGDDTSGAERELRFTIAD